LINVLGLSIGLASCLMILIYIYDEVNYDNFHEKADRIYRLNEFILTEGSGERSSSLPFPTGPTLKEEYNTLIEEQVRLFNFQAPSLAVANEENDKEFNESRVFFVDSTFFDVFDYQLVKGNKEKALNETGSILITESMAEKYFGQEDPMGKSLKFQGVQELMVTGVLEDAPLNAHFQFDFLISFSSLKMHFGGQYPNGWYWNPCWTYVVLHEGKTKEQLEEQLPDFIQKYFHPAIKDDTQMALQALTDIHLKSDLDFEIQANSSEDNIYVFSVVALLILLIASINFMNLSTARSMKRAREVGMRKVMGGQKFQLILQFLMESMVMVLLAVIIAMFMVYAVLPWFNSLAGKSIAFEILLQQNVLMGFGAVILLVGLGAGFYPALVLSSFSPVKVLKGERLKMEGGISLRKVLVVLQFSISMALIVGTIVAIRQLDMLKEQDTGFESEQIILVPVTRSSINKNYRALKQEMLSHSGVESITAIEEILGAKHQGANYRFEGMDESKLFSRLNMRHDFIRTFGMEMASGRDYIPDLDSEDTSSLVINEAMVRNLGWTNEDAIGRHFDFGRFQGEVVGVVRDFNFVSKHKEIGPLVLQLNTQPWAFNLFIKYMAIRVNTEDLQGTLTYLEDQWKTYIPERPFDYFFLDSELQKLYESEDRLSKVATVFSGFGIVVACLGLFGLASFTAEQRRKEIGIRKALGSTTSQILVLLSSEFAKLIAIAFVFAVPVSYLSLDAWLNDFAYRIDISWVTFVLAGLVAFVVAIATVGYQSVRAAISNPVDALRNES